MRCRLHLWGENLSSREGLARPLLPPGTRGESRGMEFAKGLASSAGKGARSKFRARGHGHPAKETAMELLVKRPATNSSSNGSSSPPESLPIRLPENERIKRYMDMAASMADGQNVPQPEPEPEPGPYP